jgi:hypothetical protein
MAPSIPVSKPEISSADANRGQAAFTRIGLALYDLLILRAICRWVWRCPNERILAAYAHYLSSSPTSGSAALRAFLESERDILVQTQSLLVCIAQAMGDEHAPTGPYYPDVIGLAQELLKGRVFNLDELLLDWRLPGQKT